MDFKTAIGYGIIMGAAVAVIVGATYLLKLLSNLIKKLFGKK